MTDLERVRRALWSVPPLVEILDAHEKEDAERERNCAMFHVDEQVHDAKLTELREAVRAIIDGPTPAMLQPAFEARLRKLIEEQG